MPDAGGVGGSPPEDSGADGSRVSDAASEVSPRDATLDARPDADPCDMDGDGYRSVLCGGMDCDDTAPLVFPNEPVFYPGPTHVGGIEYDYDCNGRPDPFYSSIVCSGLGLGGLCTNPPPAFLGQTAPACGQVGRFGHCRVSGLSCIEQVDEMKIMPCK